LNPVPPEHEADHHSEDRHVSSAANRPIGAALCEKMKIVMLNYRTCP